jgi:hypothetical protein
MSGTCVGTVLMGRATRAVSSHRSYCSSALDTAAEYTFFQCSRVETGLMSLEADLFDMLMDQEYIYGKGDILDKMSGYAIKKSVNIV